MRQGQLLFQIDARPFQADVDRLRAELAQATAARDRAASEMRRADRLSAENAMSLEERERRASAAAETTAHVRRRGRRAARRRARPGVHARHRADRRPRRAGRSSRAGNLVSGGQGEATLLTTVVSLDPIYASFDADEQTLLALRRARPPALVGQSRAACRSRWRWPDEQTFPHEGTLHFLDNQLDPSTGTIRGRAVFRNPRPPPDAGTVRPAAAAGHRAYHGVLVRTAPSAPISTGASCSSSAATRRLQYRTRDARAARRRPARRPHGARARRSRRGQRPAAGPARCRAVCDATGGSAGGRKLRRVALMKFSSLLHHRPIFAAVLSAADRRRRRLALLQLPVSEYPGGRAADRRGARGVSGRQSRR